MTAGFDIISDFLRRFEPSAAEVSGRGVKAEAATMPVEIEAQIRRFARGECLPEERVTLCGLLDEHREWIGQLAAIVRGLSPGEPPSSPPPPTFS